MKHLVLALAAGCLASCAAAETFQLPNGVEIELVEGTTQQEPCFFMGEAHPNLSSTVCVEIPGELAGLEDDAFNRYASRLGDAGFDFAGGAAIQYWFDWPASSDCVQRLNMTALPKQKVDGDDWAGLDAYVAVFELEASDCDTRE